MLYQTSVDMGLVTIFMVLQTSYMSVSIAKRKTGYIHMLYYIQIQMCIDIYLQFPNQLYTYIQYYSYFDKLMIQLL